MMKQPRRPFGTFGLLLLVWGLAWMLPSAPAEPADLAGAPVLALRGATRAYAADAPGARLFLPLSLHGLALEALALPQTAVPPTHTPIATSTATASATPTTAPPSATPTEPPSPSPVPPSATPLPSPTPTEAMDCREQLRNGDFEAGPALWELEVTSTRQNPGRSIQLADPAQLPAHGGRYLAWLGGVADGMTIQELTSSSISTVEASEIVSATLRYWVAIITEERSNRHDDDRLEVQILRGNRGIEVEGASRSEESFEESYRWQAVEADVTELLTDRGASKVKLRFSNSANASLRSWFYMDDVSVEVCTRRP